MSITMRTQWGLLPGLTALALSATSGACGDSSDNGGDDNGGNVDGTPVLFSPTDPCDQGDVPQPNQLFDTEELASCPLPSDPVEAAIAGLERGEGADVDVAIALQADGAILPESLSSTVTFALDGSGSPSGLPPVVLIRRIVTGTVTTYETVDFVASRDGLRVIRIEPREDLDFGVEHYVIATRAITTEGATPEALAPSPEVEVVVGNAEPGDVGIEDPVAARLLAERGRVSDVLALVATEGQPAISADDIVSIHSFRTKLGPERLVQLAQRYSDAFVAGRIGGDITITDNALPLGEISPIPPDNQDDFNEKIQNIQRGTIAMPRLLDEDGRLRSTWDTDGETIDVQFLLSEPTGGGPFRVAAMFSGFGRGTADIISMAPDNGNVGTAVMLVDLRCHGSRSPDPLGVCQEERSLSEIDGLVDTQPNNGDTRVTSGSPDGIPDDSGRFFFSGDPGQLRDSQLAAVIEILHVLSVLRFQIEELEAAASMQLEDSETGLIAHAQASPVALAALAMFSQFPDNGIPTRSRGFRAMFLGGGVGYEELILDGPNQIRTDFLATAPEGIDEDNVTSYIRELEARVLEALDPNVVGPEAAELYARTAESAIFFPNFPRDVPGEARELLDDTLSPDRYERATGVSCEHFLFFPCQGNEFQPTVQARGSAANFMSGSSF